MTLVNTPSNGAHPPKTPSPLVLLSPGDNVLVCAGPITAGQSIVIDGERFAAPQDVPTGHKVARRALAVGEKVIKYGAPIGSVVAPVARGAHVHGHNLVSDYIPTHDRASVGGTEHH
jgi:hypothetical protein